MQLIVFNILIYNIHIILLHQNSTTLIYWHLVLIYRYKIRKACRAFYIGNKNIFFCTDRSRVYFVRTNGHELMRVIVCIVIWC